MHSALPTNEAKLYTEFYDTINNFNTNKTIVTLHGQNISVHDLQSMYQSCWLNDNILETFVTSAQYMDVALCKEDFDRKPSYFVEPQMANFIKTHIIGFNTSIDRKKHKDLFADCYKFLNNKVDTLSKTYNRNKTVNDIYNLWDIIFVEIINKSLWIVHHVDIKTSEIGGPHQYNSLVRGNTKPTLFQIFIKQMLLSNQEDKVDIVSSMTKDQKWKAVV